MIWVKLKFLRFKEGPSKQTKNAQEQWGNQGGGGNEAEVMNKEIGVEVPV